MVKDLWFYLFVVVKAVKGRSMRMTRKVTGTARVLHQ